MQYNKWWFCAHFDSVRFFAVSVEPKRFSRVKNSKGTKQNTKYWNNFIAFIKITWYFQSYFLWRYQFRTESNLTGTQGYCFFFSVLFSFSLFLYRHLLVPRNELKFVFFLFCFFFLFQVEFFHSTYLNSKEISRVEKKTVFSVALIASTLWSTVGSRKAKRWRSKRMELMTNLLKVIWSNFFFLLFSFLSFHSQSNSQFVFHVNGSLLILDQCNEYWEEVDEEERRRRFFQF